MRTNNSGRVRAQFEAVVLAGERAGESGLGREFGVAAGALVPLAGRASIAWVVDAVRASYWVEGGILCGPDRTVVDGSDILRQLLEAGDFRWMQPDTGPAASAVTAARIRVSTGAGSSRGDRTPDPRVTGLRGRAP